MTTPQTDVVNFYLADLTLALRVLPVEVRREIHSGIAEELRGLDADAAQQRIDELGDPKFIAAAALDEVGSAMPAATVAGDKTWYTLTTALALLVGGIVVPFLGWFAGVVLLWNSKTWTLADKIVGTAILPFGLAASLLIVFRYGAITTSTIYLDGGNSVTEFDGDAVLAILANFIAALPFIVSVYLVIRATLLKRRAQ